MAREFLHCDVCAVRDRAACAALSEDERRGLAKIGHRRTLRRGEILFGSGDGNELSATLIKGALKMSTLDRDGSEHIVSLVHPAGLVGELFEASSRYDVVALTQSEVCVFPRQQYEEAIRRYPRLGEALLRRSSDTLAESRELLAAVSGRNSMQRVAAFLLSLGRAANDTACHPALEFDLILTRGEIASLLGLTIETVSRQLTRLERDGVIQRKGTRGILFRDLQRLRDLGT